jgi:hypothetical protein
MTLYVEDLIIGFAGTTDASPFDRSFMNNMGGQIGQGQGLTEKQASLALKILKRNQKKLIGQLIGDVESAIDTPVFRFPFRKIALANKISVVDHLTWDKALKVEFPYNQNYLDAIRNGRKDNPFIASWDKDQKAWMFDLSEGSIKFLIQLFDNTEVEMDDEFKNYATQITNILNNIEKYAPMLVIEDGKPTYKNVSKNIPPLQSTGILESLFEARKCGITTYDATIEDFLQVSDLDPITQIFLKSELDDTLFVESKQYSFDKLKNIINYLSPCLFVVPASKELESLSMVYDFLVRQGYDSDSISVMFRLPSEDASDFNNFVKQNKLNNPISENTKFVFICTKVPKPIFKSKINFEAIINLGYLNVHYTLREYMKSCQNVVYYCDKKPSKDLSYGNM